MNYLGEAEEQKRISEKNNFLVIRLLASTMVVAGHSIVLSKDYSPELMANFSIFGFTLHGIGVLMFFCLSGYLVTGSLLQRRSIFDFAISRALRIFPGIFVCVIVTTMFAWGFLTSLPAKEFITDVRTWDYIINNSSLYRAEFYLPGVSHSLNGSLWTIPFEGRLYLILGLFWFFLIARSNIGLVVASISTVYLMSQHMLPGIPMNDANFRLVACFFIGAVFFTLKKYIPLSFPLLVFVLLLTFISTNHDFKNLLFFISIGYAVLLLAYSRKLSAPRWIADYSYGIYLYSYVIQSTIIFYYPEISAIHLALISIPLSWIAGALSWNVVEKPALLLKTAYFRYKFNGEVLGK